MKTVLLPVKDFQDAKQRLAQLLSAEVRAGLAAAMLLDVLEALSAAEADRIVVYTASESVIRMVRPFGFETVLETVVGGHSAAVNRMLPLLLPTSTRVLAIAGDLPTLKADEVKRALNTDCDLAILPSRDGTGTNGMLFSPPACIELEYGEGSFVRHRQRAESRGLNLRVLQIDGIAFDVDTPDDLAAFCRQPRLDSATWRFLTSARTIGGRSVQK